MKTVSLVTVKFVAITQTVLEETTNHNSRHIQKETTESSKITEGTSGLLEQESAATELSFETEAKCFRG